MLDAKIEFDRESLTKREAAIIDTMIHVTHALLNGILGTSLGAIRVSTGGGHDTIAPDQAKLTALICTLMNDSMPELNFRMKG